MTPIEPPVGLEAQIQEITRRARHARAGEVMMAAPCAGVVLLALLGLHERADGYEFSAGAVMTAFIVLAAFSGVGYLVAKVMRRGQFDSYVPLDHGLSPEDRATVRRDIRRGAPSADPVLRYLETLTATRLVRRHPLVPWLVPLLIALAVVKLMTAWPHLLDIAVVAAGCGVVAGTLLRSRARVRPARRFLRIEKFTPHVDSSVAFESDADRRQRLALGTVLATGGGWRASLPRRHTTPDGPPAREDAWWNAGQDGQDGDTLTR